MVHRPVPTLDPDSSGSLLDVRSREAKHGEHGKPTHSPPPSPTLTLPPCAQPHTHSPPMPGPTLTSPHARPHTPPTNPTLTPHHARPHTHFPPRSLYSPTCCCAPHFLFSAGGITPWVSDLCSRGDDVVTLPDPSVGSLILRVYIYQELIMLGAVPGIARLASFTWSFDSSGGGQVDSRRVSL